MWADLTLFLTILARMTGFVVFNPIFGRTGIPGIFKSGLSLLLAATTYTMTVERPAVPETLLGLALLLGLELAVVVGVAGGEQDVPHLFAVQLRLVHTQGRDGQAGGFHLPHGEALLEYVHRALREGPVRLDKAVSQFRIHGGSSSSNLCSPPQSGGGESC